MGLHFIRPALGDARLSVEDAIAKVREAEARTRAIEVKGFKGQSFALNEADEYIPMPKRIEGTVIYDGMLGGRYVLDVVETMPVGSADSEKYGTGCAPEQ